MVCGSAFLELTREWIDPIARVVELPVRVFVDAALSRLAHSDKQVPAVGAAVAGIAFNSAVALIAYLVPKGRPLGATKWVAKTNGDLIECVLQDAVERSRLVELTTEAGKCYVGRPFDSGLSTHADSDVSLIPLMSGYRDDKLQLSITTFYSDVVDDFTSVGSPRTLWHIAQEALDGLRALIVRGRRKDATDRPATVGEHAGDALSEDDFKIVLPKRCILSARLFDIDVYSRGFRGSGKPVSSQRSA